MDDRPIAQLTLRELFTNAEGLVRELNEHLDQSFLPRLRAADEVVRTHAKVDERNDIADSTVRSRMAALFESDDFSQKLFSRLEQHLVAIDQGAAQAIQGR